MKTAGATLLTILFLAVAAAFCAAAVWSGGTDLDDRKFFVWFMFGFIGIAPFVGVIPWILLFGIPA